MMQHFCPICGKDLGLGPIMNATMVCAGKCDEIWTEREFKKLRTDRTSTDPEEKVHE